MSAQLSLRLRSYDDATCGFKCLNGQALSVSFKSGSYSIGSSCIKKSLFQASSETHPAENTAPQLRKKKSRVGGTLSDMLQPDVALREASNCRANPYSPDPRWPAVNSDGLVNQLQGSQVQIKSFCSMGTFRVT